MISERKFAEGFASFWGSLLPMSEALVRRTNLDAYLWFDPLEEVTAPERRALVNEVGFRLLRESQPPGEEVFARAEMAAAAFIATLPGGGGYPPLQGREKEEAIEIGRRLSSYFDSGEPVVVGPEFRGCGLIDHCRGDVLRGRTLFEIKAGKRDFRISDIRQVLTYCALAWVSGEYSIDRVGLLNPRTGRVFVSSLDSVCLAGGGMHSVELLSEIIRFVAPFERY